MLNGIDVSHYEPGVDWATVKDSCPFAFMKATEGTTGIDSLFQSYWTKAQQAGVIRGAYHFFHPNMDVVVQANHFVGVVGAIGKSDLPPVLDLEVTGGMSASAITSGALKFLDAVQAKTGKAPILYASPSFITELGSPAAFIKYPLWIANYGVTVPKIPKPFSQWTFWQYSDAKVVNGVPEKCDANYFNGDMSGLLKLCAG